MKNKNFGTKFFKKTRLMNSKRKGPKFFKKTCLMNSKRKKSAFCFKVKPDLEVLAINLNIILPNRASI
jgi:hypothetical protein